MPELRTALSPRRHPWPRALVRLRRAWFGAVELVSFFAAGFMAVGRFLFCRWPEPAGEDWLAPRGPARRRLRARKARQDAPALRSQVNPGGSS